MTEVSLHVRKCDLKLVFYVVIMKIKAGSQNIKDIDMLCCQIFVWRKWNSKLNKGSLTGASPVLQPYC